MFILGGLVFFAFFFAFQRNFGFLTNKFNKMAVFVSHFGVILEAQNVLFNEKDQAFLGKRLVLLGRTHQQVTHECIQQY